jgi:hypothetical protein
VGPGPSIIAPLPRPVGSQHRVDGKEEDMTTAERRLVGVDLGIASDHTVRVLRADGSEVCRGGLARRWPA